MKQRTWWEDEWWNDEAIKETQEWLEKETKLKEIKDKENTIVQAYMKDITEIKEEIRKLEEKIKVKEKECSECLAKIQNGDSGLMAILEERNGKRLIQIHIKNEVN